MNALKPQQLDPRLAGLVHGIDLQALSRVPAARLETTALPNIGTLELVSPDGFERDYQQLYLSMFHGGERERPDLIVQRLRDDLDGRRSGLAPYRVMGIRDHNGQAVGAAQFSVLPLPKLGYAVPYMQYIYIRSQNRRQDLSEVLHTMALAVATADSGIDGGQGIVPFTLFETEPPNHGTTASSQSTATKRAQIHAKSGSRGMMLVDESGQLCSSHVQPGLEFGDRPITLTWAIRPSPAPQDSSHFRIDDELGLSLLTAYYRSLREEGFREENVALAENMARARCTGRRFVEIALDAITPAMYQNLEPAESLP